MIFVFGSNLAGRHGKGAALDAVRFYGAELGVGSGPTGSAYAIPTKDANLRPLPFDQVAKGVEEFIEYAKGNPRKEFLLTPVGCGLAGHSRRQVWQVMTRAGVPSNVYLASTWVTP
jgi:hypothetical protein